MLFFFFCFSLRFCASSPKAKTLTPRNLRAPWTVCPVNVVFFHPWLPWCRLSAPQLLQRLVIPGAGAGWLEETAGVRVSSAGAAIQTDVWSSLSRRCCGQSARAPLLGNSFTLTCSQQQHKVACVLAATVAVPIAMSSKTPDRTWLAERDASKRVKKKKRKEKKAERE